MSFSFYRWIYRLFRSNRHWDDLLFFRSISVFGGLSTRQLGRIMMAMQKRTYHAGEALFSEGQIGKALFIIRSGEVELSRTVGDQVMSLGRLGSGQIFGEMALLEHTPRIASARVVEDGEIYLLYTATLDSLVWRSPAIGLVLMRNIALMLSALLRKTNHELDQRMKGS